jgi:hypothetical protein
LQLFLLDEKVVCSQFLDVLFEVAPEEKTHYENAIKENMELKEKMKK